MATKTAFYSQTQDTKSDFKTGSVLAIGNYDGIHFGHRKIIKQLNKKAKDLNLKSCLLSFCPHPVKVLAPQVAPKMINTLEQKNEILGQLGIDVVINQKFDLKYSKIEPEDFFTNHLVKHLNPKAIIVGYDFTFGKNRSGTIETLEVLGYKNGIEIIIVPAQIKEGTLVSSSLIRKLIKEGNIPYTNELLERPFYIDGSVIHGHKRGTSMGIHTANISTQNELLPSDGVYATAVSYNNKLFKSVTNIGFNPTFENTERSIETHIFDFDEEIYHQDIRLIFAEKLRDEIKFVNPAALVKQIEKDIKNAKDILKKFKYKL